MIRCSDIDAHEDEVLERLLAQIYERAQRQRRMILARGIRDIFDASKRKRLVAAEES